jgi:uncharacterized protein (DUF433 family)
VFVSELAMTHDRIVVDPDVRFGTATVRGIRITVADVLLYLASRMTAEDINATYPPITRADIVAC